MSSVVSRPSLLFVAYAAMLLVLLLPPLDFYTPNAASRRPPDHALEFPSAGIVKSLTPPRHLHRDLTSGSGFALEIWLSSREPGQTGPARIVSYSANTRARNFTLGQQGSGLVMRLRTTGTDLNGTPPLEVAGVFAAGARRHIVITYDFRSLCAYVDGRRAACRDSPQGRFDNWDPGHHLLFGNETAGNRPWLGTLFLVALYDRVLSPTEIAAAYTAAGRALPTRPAGSDVVALYRFDGGSADTGDIVRDATPRDRLDLAIPRVVEPSRDGFLSRRSTLSRVTVWSVADVTVNVLMFVPFGLLCYLALRHRGWSRAAARAVGIGAAATFSLGAESVQYLLVSRASQLEDVVLNTLGASIGVLVASTPRLFGSRGAHRTAE
jgi:hypothetical protein